jgi:hypothetical protein
MTKSMGAAVLPGFLLLVGCIGDCEEAGNLVLPASPMNMAGLNSPFDDWNCAQDWDEWDSDLSVLFSSNRNSGGGQFDLVPGEFSLEGDEDDPLEINPLGSAWLEGIADRINTGQDELGPSFWFRVDTADYYRKYPGALVFSRGDSADHDLFVLMPRPSLDSRLRKLPDSDWVVESSLAPLNTAYDEGYATWGGGQGKILFHSNRDGKYRIYQAEIPVEADGPFTWLRSPHPSGVSVSRVEGLAASDGEERCPSILGDNLYFVSDRSGGSGGFDIYRSRWTGTGWSEPENLGPAINSAYDEYRPAPIQVDDRTGGLIFSSNRPGGMGGFDLYLVALGISTKSGK